MRVRLGGAEGGVFDVGLPVIAGERVENLFGFARPRDRDGVVSLFESGPWLLGAATVPVAVDLESTTRRLYEDILRSTRGHPIARMWNYIPAINEPGAGGLENYRLFCRGRSLAFEQYHGSGFDLRLPSASAVGSKAKALTVVFAACPDQPRHVENPLQMAAYKYPADYGPRAPSFARATLVPGREYATVFIAGTASIRGHSTIAPDNLRQQVECTLENLREISTACGIGPDLDQGGHATRHFKIYLRHAGDQPEVAAILENRLLVKTDHVSYLEADACRAALLVEIEASLFDVATR